MNSMREVLMRVGGNYFIYTTLFNDWFCPKNISIVLNKNYTLFICYQKHLAHRMKSIERLSELSQFSRSNIQNNLYVIFVYCKQKSLFRSFFLGNVITKLEGLTLKNHTNILCTYIFYFYYATTKQISALKIF